MKPKCWLRNLLCDVRLTLDRFHLKISDHRCRQTAAFWKGVKSMSRSFLSGKSPQRIEDACRFLYQSMEEQTKTQLGKLDLEDLINEQISKVVESKLEENNRKAALRHKPDPQGQVLYFKEERQTSLERWMKIFNQIYADMVRLGLPIHKPDYVSVRRSLRVTLGKCYCESLWDVNTRTMQKHFYIYFNPDLLKLEEERILRDTFAHELIHTIDGCMNHSKLFKYYASFVNDELGCRVTSTFSVDLYPALSAADKKILDVRAQRQTKYQYQVQCIDCKMTINRQRKSKLIEHPERYRCGRCGGRLKRTK